MFENLFQATSTEQPKKKSNLFAGLFEEKKPQQQWSIVSSPTDKRLDLPEFGGKKSTTQEAIGEEVIPAEKLYYQTAKTIQEETAKSGASLALTALRQKEITSEELRPGLERGFKELVFGKEPIKPIEQRIAEAEISLQREGLPFVGRPELVQGKEAFLAPIAVGGSIILDFTGWGGGKSGAVKALAKMNKVTDVSSALKKMGVGNDIIVAYAPLITKTTKEADMVKIVNRIEELQKTTKFVGQAIKTEEEATKIIGKLQVETPAIQSITKKLTKTADRTANLLNNARVVKYAKNLRNYYNYYMPEFERIVEGAIKSLPRVDLYTRPTGAKSLSSIVAKIGDYAVKNKSPLDMQDIIGGKLVFPDRQSAYKALKEIQQKLNVEKTEDYFKAPKSGYQGINLNIKLPSGAMSELQLHDVYSATASDVIHDRLYKAISNLTEAEKALPINQKKLRMMESLGMRISGGRQPIEIGTMEKFRVGITSVKGRELQAADALVEEAQRLEKMADYTSAKELFLKALDSGIAILKVALRFPFPGVSVIKIKPTFGRYFKETEPSIYVEMFIDEKNIDEVVSKLSDIADTQIKQKSFILHRNISKDYGDLWGYGRIDSFGGKDGKLYSLRGITVEPAIKIRFNREIGLKDFPMLDDIISKYDTLVGETVYPDNKTIEIINLTAFNEDYARFQQEATALVGELKKRNLLAAFEPEVKEVRHIGIEGESITTYEQIRRGFPPIPKEIRPEKIKPITKLEEPRLATKVSSEIAKEAIDFAKKNPDSSLVAKEFRNKRTKELESGPLLFKRIGEALKTGEINIENLPEITQKYKLTNEQVATLFEDAASYSGRTLQALSRVEKELRKLLPDIQIAKREPSVWEKFKIGYLAMDNFRRSLLVTQLATAARNAISQAGRYSLETLNDGMAGIISKITGKGEGFTPFFEDIAAIFRKTDKNNFQMIQNLLKKHPLESARLYNTPVGDVALTNKISNVFNTLNRGQEYFFRNLILDAKIHASAKYKKVPIEKLGIEDVAKAVDEALEWTFSKSPTRGSFGDAIMRMYRAMPLLTLANPFPRFMSNAVKFLFDYSPMGIMSLFSSKTRAAIASGDYNTITKAILGTSMLGAAMVIRNNQDIAGEKWYEIKWGDKTIDARPFAPFTTYLFFAEIMVNGTGKISGADWSQAALGINRIAGTGLALLDLIDEKVDGKTAKNIVNGIVSVYIGGFTVPFATIKDVIGNFRLEERTAKETREIPIIGGAIGNIPGLNELLPTKYSMFEDKPLQRESTLLRQMTGLTVYTKPFIQKEMDRMGKDWWDLAPKTGNLKANRIISKQTGVILDKFNDKLEMSEKYKKMSDEAKLEFLKELVSEAKKEAKGEVASDLAGVVYNELKNTSPSERKKVITELKNKGLMTENILDYLLQMIEAQPLPK